MYVYFGVNTTSLA